MQLSSTGEEFGEVLGRVLAETHTSVRRLERLSGVSRRTVENWLNGPVRRPRHWEPVLRVARALHLPAAETDALLRAAGLPTLGRLQQANLTRVQTELLVMWHAPPHAPVGLAAADEQTSPALPVPATGFVGRDAQLAGLEALLNDPQARLITVTGAGGIGKTRLALEVARRNAAQYQHGVYFVPLETVTTAGQLADRIIAGLNYRRSPAIPSDVSILNFLRGKNTLLLLDTLEHLLAELQLISRIIQAAPGVQVMATSRSVLRLGGEYVYNVPAMVGPETSLDLTTVAQTEAVTLFAARVREIRPDFTLTEANTADVAAICRVLGGLPLAIELAAAKTRVLSLPQLRLQLSHGLGILAGGPRDAPARQRSISETLAWSYNLLSPAEQALLRSLSVLSEGCTLAAAEAVAPPELHDHGQFIDVLSSLIDHSLLQVQRQGHRRTYILHEATCRFARERLVEAGESDATMSRLLEFMCGLAERMNEHFRAADRNHWLALFEPESAHVGEVFDWGLGTGDAAVVEKTLALAGALLQFWNVRGHHETARKWTTSALEVAERLGIPKPARGKTLIAASSMALILTDIAASQAYASDALEAAREGGDRALAVRARHLLGLCAFARGELDDAAEIWEESLRLAEELGQPSLLAAALDDLGNLAARRGEYDRALAFHRREQAVSVAAGDLYSEFYAVINLGEVSVLMGQPASAEPYYRRALEVCHRLGDSRGLAHTMLTQAVLVLQLGRPGEAWDTLHEAVRQAWAIKNLDIVLRGLELIVITDEFDLKPVTRARLGGAVDGLSERYASASLPTNREELARLGERLGRVMAESDLALEWGIGRSLTWEGAVALVLGESVV